MKPGSKRIIFGIFIFLAGAIIVPLGIIVSLIVTDSNKLIFKVPGSIRYSMNKPGQYYLWNEYKIVFDGISYNRSKDIPDGIQIRIRNEQTGQVYTFVSNASISSDSGGSARNSIGYIESDSPGNVLIEVQGGNEERIFSISQFRLWRIFSTIFGGIGFAIFICLAGGLVIVWGIVAMARSSSDKKIVVDDQKEV